MELPVKPIELWADYATIDETAAGLAMCTKTVRRNLNKPNGWPHCRMGGKVRIHLPTIRKIIEAETISRNASRHKPKAAAE
jgi:hypothetical protein